MKERLTFKILDFDINAKPKRIIDEMIEELGFTEKEDAIDEGKDKIKSLEAHYL